MYESLRESQPLYVCPGCGATYKGHIDDNFVCVCGRGNFFLEDDEYED